MTQILFHPHYNPFPHTLQHPTKMESVKRVVVGGTLDHLLEEIVSIITAKVVESSEAPLKDLRSLRLCNKAMKRACSALSPIVSTWRITTSLWFGEKETRSTHISKLLTGCKVRTMQKPFSSRGWETYVLVTPVVQHFSHEQKRRETYEHLTCWPSSSTKSTARPRMCSTTSNASMVNPLLVRRS
jgi:hypothetical protein